MERIALIYDGGILYWSSVIVTMAVLSAICSFLCLYLRQSENTAACVVVIPLAFALSLLLSRLLYWYAYTESFNSLWHALADYSTGGFVLLGAFVGCPLAAVLTEMLGLHRDTPKILDCMCLSGGAAISVGRLSSVFNASARGQIISAPHNFPWISPVVNAVSGVTEYRLATFLLQASVTGIITASLLLHHSKRNQHYKDGDTALLFLLCYCASQIVLDSTRYDSIFFHRNGFISIVQVSAAITMVIVIALLSLRMVKTHGLRLWHLLILAKMTLLLGIAGYMEYYVQRHGDRPMLAYVIMSLCLFAVIVFTLVIYHYGRQSNKQKRT